MKLYRIDAWLVGYWVSLDIHVTAPSQTKAVKAYRACLSDRQSYLRAVEVLA